MPEQTAAEGQTIDLSMRDGETRDQWNERVRDPLVGKRINIDFLNRTAHIEVHQVTVNQSKGRRSCR